MYSASAIQEKLAEEGIAVRLVSMPLQAVRRPGRRLPRAFSRLVSPFSRSKAGAAGTLDNYTRSSGASLGIDPVRRLGSGFEALAALRSDG